MTSAKPTVLLVHGSWLNPSFYKSLVARLELHGYPTHCPLLPSCAPTATADTDLIDDALAIRARLTRLVEYEGRTVIVAMHSYGGLVGSEAVAEALTTRARHERQPPQAGGVVHLFYMGAFTLPAGQSCQSFFGDMPGSHVVDGFYTDPEAKTRLFADLPSDEADQFLARLVPHPFKVQQTTTTRAAYTDTPSTYVVFTRDAACPPPAQEQFASAMGATVVKFDSGHMAPLSHPIELGDVMDRAIQSIDGLSD